MANSKTWSSLFLTLNFLLFALVSGRSLGPSPSPSTRPTNLSDDSSDPVTRRPRDLLNIGISANLLGQLINATVGQSPRAILTLVDFSNILP
ncbi:hypothetical protein CR513_45735, partial [Mucuna pruriens]